MKRVKMMLVAAVPLLLVTSAYAEPQNGVQECWQDRQDRGGINWADAEYDLAMVVDDDGNVYVTHPHWNGMDSDIVTRRYDPYGELCWEVTWDGEDVGALPDNEHPGDVPHDIAVAHGHVYVTGQTLRAIYRDDNDYITICYSAATGNKLWECFYDYAEEDDEAYAIAPTSAPCFSAVYVTGESKRGPNDITNDIATIKYNATSMGGCAEMWVERYQGLSADYAGSIVVEGGCTVYVGGATYRAATFFDYLVVSYSSGGVERWAEVWDGPGLVEVDPEIIRDMTICNGILYATGQAYGGIGTGLDYGTIAVDCSNGNLLGSAIYGGAGPDVAWGIAEDSWGYVYVTGEDKQGDDYYLATVKYDYLVHEPGLAMNIYPYPSRGRDIVVDECDYPHATGWRVYDSATNPSNYLTIKYQQHDPGDPGDFDREWVKIQSHDGLDESYVIATWGCQTVYVTGESEGDDGELDVVTKKYSQTCCCACPCDLSPGWPDCDDVCNVSDFTVFAQAYGSQCGDLNYNPCADLAPPGAPDGVINVSDFTVFTACCEAGCS